MNGGSDDGCGYPPTDEIPEEIDRFGRATHNTGPFYMRAKAQMFPDLVVEPPLVLRVDEVGFWTLTLRDPSSGDAITKFVRRDWAYQQRLAALGVRTSRLALARGRVIGREEPLFGADI